MILVKANAESEAGVAPAEELLSEVRRYNDRLVRAGVLLAGDGLHPSARGFRVKFSGSRREVVPGPFPDTGELLAGYWLLQVRSAEEAIEWVKRIPNPSGGESVVEIRPVVEAGDRSHEKSSMSGATHRPIV
jgi:hypothetical protein